MNPIPQPSPEEVARTLQILEAVKARLLMEMWTNTLLSFVGLGLFAYVALSFFRWRKAASIPLIAIGGTLFYLPVTIAPTLAFSTLGVAGALLVREIVLRPVPKNQKDSA
jgi:hypothetical protein